MIRDRKLSNSASFVLLSGKIIMSLINFSVLHVDYFCTINFSLYFEQEIHAGNNEINTNFLVETHRVGCVICI